MPYFSWRAIDLTGTIRKGFVYGNDVSIIQDRLFKFDMALLSCKELRFGLWRYPIRQSDKAQFFFRLHTLLARGVVLSEALSLLYRTTKHPLLQALLYQIIDDIQQGTPLHATFAKHPDVFDTFTVQLVKAGESSGALAQAFHNLSEHVQQQMKLKKKMRAALVIPAITLAIFVVVIAVILTVVLPAFMSAFGTSVELPLSTQLLLALQRIISDWFFVGSVVVVGILAVWFLYVRNLPSVQQARDRFLIQAPGVSYLYRHYDICRTLQACGLLLERGVPIIPSLQAVRATVRNRIIQQRIDQSIYDITHGIPVSQAFFEHKLLDEEGMCLVQIGQATGKLGAMVVQVAHLYQERVYRSLKMVTTLLQPLLMVVLGLLVVWVIAAVYMPILNLSTQISM
jgi:type IV pilus assembly protein PilC